MDSQDDLKDAHPGFSRLSPRVARFVKLCGVEARVIESGRWMGFALVPDSLRGVLDIRETVRVRPTQYGAEGQWVRWEEAIARAAADPVWARAMKTVWDLEGAAVFDLLPSSLNRG